MATGDLEVLDRGLGCPEVIEELTMSVERSRKQSQEEKAKGDEQAERRDEVSSQAQGPMEEEQALDGEGSRGARPSKAKAEKERGKTAAAPKSAPVRKKSKAPSQPQLKLPRALGPGSDELPWGEITLNKCLALASVVAVLSVAFQVFQDVIDGEDEGPEAPALWAWPGGSAPRDSQPKLPKPKDWAKASAPAPPPGPKPPVKDTPEAAPKEQEAEAKGSPAPAPEVAAPPEEPPPSSQPAKSEKLAGAAMPRKEEKARSRKGLREDRAEPPWRERKEGSHGPRPRREEPEEAPRRPWEREHRHSGQREDPKKARDGPRSKREEQRGRQKHEDRERFFPKQKLREGKRRD